MNYFIKLNVIFFIHWKDVHYIWNVNKCYFYWIESYPTEATIWNPWKEATTKLKLIIMLRIGSNYPQLITYDLVFMFCKHYHEQNQASSFNLSHNSIIWTETQQRFWCQTHKFKQGFVSYNKHWIGANLMFDVLT